ncbi:MAG: hypothetical protein NZM03_05955, partial [Limisphaera sp.]|nr:hypothetical protein [Limisphaera sp.]
HYRSLTVNSGARLNFRRNARNTPVFILSQGDIVVNGVIDVNGAAGTTTDGGAPGPGGFAGGKPGFGTVPAGDGQGPGGGRRGNDTCDSSTWSGNGAYGNSGNNSPFAPTYGNAVLTPMIGGSGGGGVNGSPGRGGGGGGGAILLASNTRIRVNGTIEARGGAGNACFQQLGEGSGGAIRLVALRVEGNGLLDVRGPQDRAGRGRIRVDTLERDGIAFNFQGVSSVGQNLFALPPVIPRLDTIEVAGTPFPEGSNPGTVTLPFGASPERTVKIQARDFGRVVPIRVVLTPDSGPRIEVDAQVDNTTVNPAVVEVPVTFPVNTRVTVHCWTR